MSEGRLANSQRIRVKVGANGTRAETAPGSQQRTNGSPCSVFIHLICSWGLGVWDLEGSRGIGQSLKGGNGVAIGGVFDSTL